MTASRTDFSAPDFAAAWRLVRDAGTQLAAADVALVGSLGCGVSRVATDVSDDGSPALRTCSRAFVVGFLLGHSLRCLVGAGSDLELGAALPAAVDRVYASGRQTIIARSCDLAAVAVSERALTRSLLRAEAADGDDEDASARVERCFEAGPAVALVLEPAMGETG